MTEADFYEVDPRRQTAVIREDTPENAHGWRTVLLGLDGGALVDAYTLMPGDDVFYLGRYVPEQLDVLRLEYQFADTLADLLAALWPVRWTGHRCPACRAPVVPTVTMAGRLMPVDPAYRVDGRVLVTDAGSAGTISRTLHKNEALPEGARPVASHYATCSGRLGRRRRRSVR